MEKKMFLPTDIKTMTLLDKIKLLFIKKKTVIDRSPSDKDMAIVYKEHNGSIYVYECNSI
jgi:hypothetical protein